MTKPTLRSLFLDSERRLRTGWWFPLYLFCAGAFGLPVLFVLHARGVELTESQRHALTASFFILAGWACQALRRRPLAELGLRLDGRWLRELCVGLALGAALMLAPALLLTAVRAVHWQLPAGGAALLLPGLGLCAAVALGEEVFFRGFLFQRLVHGLGRWPAQLLVAVLFVATHWNNPGMSGLTRVWASVNIFLASLLFGAAFLRTRALAMPLGLHLAANWVQGSVLGFGVSGFGGAGLLQPELKGPDWLTGGAFGLEASLPGLLCVAALLALVLRWRGASPADNPSP
ncbi:CPBP family intramembrane metalloprotease [Aggregicoccus sp. 17bor-14]|uniref:CPBP family intramembrane glutamic endopeptidase n=1 Tax=Myxococcaceae TaxID=31 RepID=UPI00129CFE70|nr:MULTISPECIES: CPBP family intramembrane glutamic endopeptidase [Myxococcaceae]MBF5041645.1 CPBP family intramembrane metalloprotease [Simulacricoccus sp. 17bor-14]MRI87429.1 CPBP family intramembrane metalloprotease [Aggregicoccus sp. 17bor-14]